MASTRHSTASRRRAGALLALLITGATLFGPSAVSTAAATYRSFIVAPDSPGGVSRPSGVVFDALGGAYVADTGNDRVAVYAPDGTYLRAVGSPGSGSGALASPSAVALAGDSLYVADAGHNRIAVYSMDGTFSRELTVTAPLGVAAASDGTVYATGVGADIVRVFRIDGSQTTWGATGVTDGLFLGPHGVAVNSPFLYVADTGNRRIQVLNATTGSYLNQWGPEPGPGGTTVSRYVTPIGISVAPGGDLLVTDSNAHWVQRVAQFGYAQVAAWGTKGLAGSVEGSFTAPLDATVSGSGTLFVADAGNDRVARHSGSWMPPISANTTLSGGFWRPRAAAADASGTLLVADSGNDRLPLVDSEGAWLGVFGGGVDDPRGIAIAPNGERLVSDAGSDVVRRFSVTGEALGSFGSGLLLDPGGLTVAADGTVYVADSGNHRIARFSSGGVFQTSFGSFGSADDAFNLPTDVDLDAVDGSLWVADSGNHRIKKIAASNGTFRLKVPSTAGSGSSTGRFNAPSGLAVDPSGGVLVADTGNDRIQRFDRAGAHVETFGSPGILRDRMHAPLDVAVAPGNRVWVIERDGARLQAFTADSQAPVASALGVPAWPVAEDVDVSIAATDTGAGVADIWWRLNEGVPQRYEGPLRISAEGTTTLGWWASDRVGNVSIEQTAAVVIDRTPPSGSFLVGDGGYWNPASPATVVSDITDAVRMRLGLGTDFGAWFDYTTTATVDLPTLEGKYVVTAEYEDHLGNMLRLTQPFGVDLNPPVAPVISSSTHPEGTVARSLADAEFSWSEPADLSGAEAYSWVLDREPTTTPAPFGLTGLRSATVDVPSSGEWYFHVRARDMIGNWGDAAHYRIVVSTTPVLSAPRPVRVGSFEGGQLWEYSGSVTPAHAGCAVRVWALKRVNREWVAYSFGDAIVSSEAGVMRYRGSFGLPPGAWRLVAVHRRHGLYENARSGYSAPFVVR